MEICTRSEIIDARTMLNNTTFQINGLELSTEPINYFYNGHCEEVFITTDGDEYNDIAYDKHVTPIRFWFNDDFKSLIYMDRFDDKLKGLLWIKHPCEFEIRN